MRVRGEPAECALEVRLRERFRAGDDAEREQRQKRDDEQPGRGQPYTMADPFWILTNRSPLRRRKTRIDNGHSHLHRSSWGSVLQIDSKEVRYITPLVFLLPIVLNRS